MKKHIPNILTLGNVFFGCVAVVSVFYHMPKLTLWSIGICLLLDFLDGFTARILGVSSEIGKQLDSLADAISFGFVPGAIVYVFIRKATIVDCENLPSLLPFVGFAITVFSVLRLAKFNLDENQSDQFIGLPTPANTLFFVTIPLLQVFDREHFVLTTLLDYPFILGFISVATSLLLVSKMPLLALKFKTFGWKGNQMRYLLLISSLVLVLLFNVLAIVFILILYLILSFIGEKLKK